MSIIYGTLERLEAEQSASGENNATANSIGPVSGSAGLAKKLITAAAIVVVAGVSLMFLRQFDSSGAVHRVVTAEVAVEPLRPVEGSAQSLPPVVVDVAQTAADTEPLSSEVKATEEHQPVAPEPEPVVEPDPALEPVVVATAGQDPANPDAIEKRTIEDEPVVVSDAPAVAAPQVQPAQVIRESEPVDRGEQAVDVEPVPASGLEEQIDRARLVMSRGHYAQALSALDGIDPVPVQRVDFWFLKGSAHLGIGQLDLAQTSFESAQAMAPDNAQIAVQRAVVLQEKDDHAGALQILDLAATRHPGVPEVFLNQGYSRQALGAAADAGRSFRIFLQLTENRSVYAQQRAAVQNWLLQMSSFR